jgi:hypothetical protein
MQTTPLPRDTTMVWCCICSTCAYWSEESTHHLMIMSLSAEMVSFVCQMPQSSCRSVQANIEYLYIRSYGQTASVTSNLWVYSRT